jgi:GT2 family glycosyltransferase
VSRLPGLRSAPDGAPLVSVVIPTYNRAERLLRAVDSVLRQSFGSLEVLVIDDGSTDDTANVMRSIDDPRVKYFVQENQGPASARNRGAALASGQIITFLDSDDLALPGWLGNMVQPFTVHNADIVYCGVEVIPQSNHTGRRLVHLPKPMGPVFGNIRGWFFTAGAYALRKSVFESAGGFDPACHFGEHTELAIRLGDLSERLGLRVHTIMAPYVQYIDHDGERLFRDPQKRLEGIQHIIAKHHARLRRDRRLLATYWGVAGVSAHRLGDRALASSHFLKGAKLDPLRAQHWLRYLMSVTGLVPPWIWTKRPIPSVNSVQKT